MALGARLNGATLSGSSTKPRPTYIMTHTPITLQATLSALLAYDIPVEIVSTEISPYSRGECWWVGGAEFGTGNHKYSKIRIMGDPSDQDTLISGLHEVGHTYHEDSDPLLERRLFSTTVGVLENEAQAWLWALDYCEREGIYLESRTLERVRYAFNSYYQSRNLSDLSAHPYTDELRTRLEKLS